MWIGGYTLELYCDNEKGVHAYNEFPHAFLHEFGSECRSTARKNGWILHLDGTATCPKCSGKQPLNHKKRIPKT